MSCDERRGSRLGQAPPHDGLPIGGQTICPPGGSVDANLLPAGGQGPTRHSCP